MRTFRRRYVLLFIPVVISGILLFLQHTSTLLGRSSKRSGGQRSDTSTWGSADGSHQHLPLTADVLWSFILASEDASIQSQQRHILDAGDVKVQLIVVKSGEETAEVTRHHHVAVDSLHDLQVTQIKGEFVTLLDSQLPSGPNFTTEVARVFKEFKESEVVCAVGGSRRAAPPFRTARQLLLPERRPSTPFLCTIRASILHQLHKVDFTFWDNVLADALYEAPALPWIPSSKQLFSQPSSSVSRLSADLLLEHLPDLHYFFPSLRMTVSRNESVSVAAFHLANLVIDKLPDQLDVAASLLERSLQSWPANTPSLINLGYVSVRRNTSLSAAALRLLRNADFGHRSGEVSACLQRLHRNTSDVCWLHNDVLDSAELFLREREWLTNYADPDYWIQRRPFVLANEPGEALSAYDGKGNANCLRDGYYNALRFFDLSYILSPVEEKSGERDGYILVPTTTNELAQRLTDLRVDVFRGYGGYAGCPFAVSAKVEGIPVVCSAHDQRRNYCCLPSVYNADFMWTTSNIVADRVLQYRSKPFPASRVYLFADRVNLTNHYPRARSHPQVQRLLQQYPGEHRILYVGRQSPEKNGDTLIRALALLPTTYVLVMVGAGSGGFYEKIAVNASVTKRVFFVPSVANEHLPFYYALADVFCTPSLAEGFGIVFVEALASGRVVVTSNIAPMNEYIVHMQSGLLVDEPRSPTALAQTLRLGVEDARLRGTLEKHAVKAAKRFSKQRIDRLEVELHRTMLRHSWRFRS